MCCFNWNEEDKKYISKPFNFYIYPKSQLNDKANCRLGINREFSCQARGLEFLAENNFDFNKWIHAGIPYLNTNDEAYIRDKIASISVNENMDVAIPEEHQVFIAESMSAIHKWLQNSSKPRFLVETPTSFVKKLIYQESKKLFNNFLGTQGRPKGVEFTRLTTEQKQDLVSQPTKSEELLKELDEYIGVRKLTDYVAELGIPLVFHNGLLDSMYLMHHFYSPLPDNVEDFKTELHKKFPTYVFTLNVEYTIRNISRKIHKCR